MSSPVVQVPQPYGSFYKHVAYCPEVGLFRRFGAFWAKKVHDDTSEVLACLALLNKELEKWPQLEARTVLDCPKRFIKERCVSTDPDARKGIKALYKAWDKYDGAMMRYGKTLCMSQHIMNMPTQDDLETKVLMQWKAPNFKPIFGLKEFIPTGEGAEKYQGRSADNDVCAWRASTHGDYLTKLFKKACPWIHEWVVVRWRWIVHNVKPSHPSIAPTINSDTIMMVMDTLTCVFASVLLAVTVAVLAVVRPLRIRIALVCVFGTLFALLLKLMAGSPARGEIFGATAAFYAVAVVFVGSTNSDYSRD